MIGSAQGPTKAEAIAAAQAIFTTTPGGMWLPDPSVMFSAPDGAALAGSGVGVGLLMDASRGMVIGSEMVSNGTFATSTGWLSNPLTNVVYGSNGLSFGYGGSGFIWKNITTTINKTYKIVINVEQLTGNNLNIFIGNPTTKTILISSAGVTTITYLADSTRTQLGIYYGSSLTQCIVKSLSAKEVDGYHAGQYTIANRPLRYLTAQTGRNYLSADATDSLVATVPNWGTNCTVITRLPTELVVATGQTVSGATTIVPASKNFCGKAIFNAPLTSDQLFIMQQLFGWYGTAGTNGSPL